MRRLAFLVLATAVLSATGALAAGNPHAEKVHLTRSGNRLARLTVLRHGDLPDWTQIPSPPNDNSLTCPGFDPDVSALTINGKATAAFRGSALAEIQSTADVFASHAQAVTDFKAGAKSQLAGCLRYLMDKAFRASSGPVKASVLSARMLRAPSLGERAAAYRLVSRVRVSTLAIKGYTDLLVIQRGRTIAALIFTGIDNPVPSQSYYGRTVAARMR